MTHRGKILKVAKLQHEYLNSQETEHNAKKASYSKMSKEVSSKHQNHTTGVTLDKCQKKIFEYTRNSCETMDRVAEIWHVRSRGYIETNF